MKTVLFFISSTRHSCKQRIDGIRRFAKGAGWHIQVVERAFNPVDVARIIGFWKPVGIIAECANGADELNAKNFGKIPVVYFDEAFGAKGRGFYIRLDWPRSSCCSSPPNRSMAMSMSLRPSTR